MYKHNSAASEDALIMVQLFHHKRPMDGVFKNERTNYSKQSLNCGIYPYIQTCICHAQRQCH
jgi:hypothetical protein